jgi:hypothetical protein
MPNGKTKLDLISYPPPPSLLSPSNLLPLRPQKCNSHYNPPSQNQPRLAQDSAIRKEHSSASYNIYFSLPHFYFARFRMCFMNFSNSRLYSYTVPVASTVLVLTLDLPPRLDDRQTRSQVWGRPDWSGRDGIRRRTRR